jgi:hypothetical protein
LRHRADEGRISWGIFKDPPGDPAGVTAAVGGSIDKKFVRLHLVLAKKITVSFIGFISPNMNLQKEDRDGTTDSYYNCL